MTTGIIQILINNNTVRSLVGLNKAGDKYKVYPLIVPQPEKHPYIVVRLIGRPPVECKDVSPSSFTPTVEVLCYHENYEGALALEEAVINALDNTTGTYGGVRINELRYSDTSEDFVNFDSNGLYVRRPTFLGHESTTT
ncbi:MAG: hypothetical protein VKL39_02885 [Leptolyngbyaceae bacterium]|nr:hypothetical protein [Leptolyngbyaceae bacterium]